MLRVSNGAAARHKQVAMCLTRLDKTTLFYIRSRMLGILSHTDFQLYPVVKHLRETSCFVNEASPD